MAPLFVAVKTARGGNKLKRASQTKYPGDGAEERREGCSSNFEDCFGAALPPNMGRVGRQNYQNFIIHLTALLLPSPPPLPQSFSSGAP